MIEETFDANFKNEYFAINAPFHVVGQDEQIKLNRLDDVLFIRANASGEVIITTRPPAKNIIYKYMFIPHLELKKRQLIFCQGQSGSGKSYLLNDYVKLYKTFYPRNEVMYFTLNSAEVDTSLTLNLYKVVDMKKFCETLAEESEDFDKIKALGAKFKNKLLVFDDVGNLKNIPKAQTLFWNFIDQSVENFRKFDVNVYIISHSSRTGNKGTIMKEELTQYVIQGNAIQTSNDRILGYTFGFNKTLIDEIQTFEPGEKWVSIDTKRRIVMYSTEMCTLAYLST